jgi:hypothetical protein
MSETSINKYIEKEINIPIFFSECSIDITDTKDYFISKIEESINSKENNNHKTNVKGKMTPWNFFVNDQNFHKILDKGVEQIGNFIKLRKSYLKDAWGIKIEKGNETLFHNHDECKFSGILYLNNTELPIYFPQLDINIVPKMGTFLLFSAILNHGTNVNKSEQAKYAIPFNFSEVKTWDQ